MDIRSRILKGRLLEEMTREPIYSEELGLSDRSRFRGTETPQPGAPCPENEAGSPESPDPET